MQKLVFGFFMFTKIVLLEPSFVSAYKENCGKGRFYWTWKKRIQVLALPVNFLAFGDEGSPIWSTRRNFQLNLTQMCDVIKDGAHFAVLPLFYKFHNTSQLNSSFRCKNGFWNHLLLSLRPNLIIIDQSLVKNDFFKFWRFLRKLEKHDFLKNYRIF